MNIQRLLAGAFALVLISGLGMSQAFANPLSGAPGAPSPSVATPQGSVVINFDGLTQGFVGTVFPHGGVTFSTTGVDMEVFPSDGSTLPNAFGAHAVSKIDFSGDIIVDLPSNTCANDFEVFMGNLPFQAQAFGISGNLLTTIVGSSFAQTLSFAGFPVHSVVMTGTFYGIDEITFSPETCVVVGGELLPIDSTALLLAGTQTNAVWILSALVVIGSIAFGALYITSKKN